MRDMAVEIGAVVIGMVWTWFKTTEMFRSRAATRYIKAIEALEAGVEYAYETYTRELKLANEDGKLTNEERKRARDMAISAAKAFARERGISLVAELGEDYLDLWVSKVVRSRELGGIVGPLDF